MLFPNGVYWSTRTKKTMDTVIKRGFIYGTIDGVAFFTSGTIERGKCGYIRFCRLVAGGR